MQSQARCRGRRQGVSSRGQWKGEELKDLGPAERVARLGGPERAPEPGLLTLQPKWSDFQRLCAPVLPPLPEQGLQGEENLGAGTGPLV